MHESDAALLEGLFKRYYFENATRIAAPLEIGSREFGFQRIDGQMVRHLSLRDEDELRLLLVSKAPAGVYCSNAYYSFPDLEMDEKDWKGADLIFDVDAKDLGLDCRQSHTAYLCSDCRAPAGEAPPCGRCGSARRSGVSVACRKCMRASAAEVAKLVEMLEGDLGVEPAGIRTYFSGNEGFHVHAHAPHLQGLGPRERGEIADYVRFRGAVPERYGVAREPGRKGSGPVLPDVDEPGWGGRLARGLFPSKAARKRFVADLGADAYGSYEEALRRAAGTIGVRIDPNVTTDVHRIFRMPGTINGKSGLAKVLCPDPADFDPYTEACVLDDSKVAVTADCPVEFRLRGKWFGPYSDERVGLPGYAAAYLVCKGLATSAGMA